MSPNVILQQYTDSSPSFPLGADIATISNFLFVSVWFFEKEHVSHGVQMLASFLRPVCT